MLYQENREGEQGNPFRAGPTGLAPERPRASHGGAEATAEQPVSSSSRAHARPGTCTHTRGRKQACARACTGGRARLCLPADFQIAALRLKVLAHLPQGGTLWALHVVLSLFQSAEDAHSLPRPGRVSNIPPAPRAQGSLTPLEQRVR